MKDRRKQQLLSRSTRGRECKRAGMSEEQIEERVASRRNFTMGHKATEGVRGSGRESVVGQYGM